jgi:hypothetical protein
MRISYNARTGEKYHKPKSNALKVLSRPQAKLKEEFMSACDGIDVSRAPFANSKGSSGMPVDAPTAKFHQEMLDSGNEEVVGRIRGLLIEMLRRDDALRLSEGVQARYAQQPDSWEWKWKVTDDVQKQVCEEFGFSDSMAQGLDLLRSSMSLFPHDNEVRRAAHYLQYNIHTSCPWMLAQVVPDVKLHFTNGGVTSLDAIVKGNKPTVVIAGSHT